MNPKLETLSHGPLAWQDSLPAGFSGVRLPGGHLASAIGEFGSLCIQEFTTRHYTIRYNVLHTLQRFILLFRSREKGLYSQLVLEGKAVYESDKGKQILLRKNNLLLSKSPTREITGTFSDKAIFHSLDTFFSQSIINKVLNNYPVLKSGLDGSTEIISLRADAETLDLANSILHCRYDDELRRHFFNSRARDLLFKYLVLLSKQDPNEKQPSEREIEAVYRAEQIISSDIGTHVHIYDLSKRVSLNEFRFKMIFKKIFGVGPYEYLLRQRMGKAKEWLESGLSVKEVAAKIGYRPTDFTSAFGQFYGYPPSVVKKRNS